MDAVNATAYGDTETSFYSFINLSINILYYTFYPIAKLLYVLYVIVLAILAPVWRVFRFLVSPLTNFASAVLYAASLPLVFVSKLEVCTQFPALFQDHREHCQCFALGFSSVKARPLSLT